MLFYVHTLFSKHILFYPVLLFHYNIWNLSSHFWLCNFCDVRYKSNILTVRQMCRGSSVESSPLTPDWCCKTEQAHEGGICRMTTATPFVRLPLTELSLAEAQSFLQHHLLHPLFQSLLVILHVFFLTLTFFYWELYCLEWKSCSPKKIEDRSSHKSSFEILS